MKSFLLLATKIIFVITSSVKDVCGKPPTERLFLDKYGKICLCLDEIVWKGLLENTDKERIRRLSLLHHYGGDRGGEMLVKRPRDEVEQILPEWRGELLSFKELKKQLKLIDPQSREGNRCKKRMSVSLKYCSNGRAKDVKTTRDDIGFIRLLEGELEKVNIFFMEKQETYIIILKELQNRVANLDYTGEMLQVQKDILDFHGEMISLLHFCVLNLRGLTKIVKKYNRRTGTSVRSPIMPRVLQQPLFATDLLYKLMRECEAMLNRLFLVIEP